MRLDRPRASRSVRSRPGHERISIAACRRAGARRIGRPRGRIDVDSLAAGWIVWPVGPRHARSSPISGALAGLTKTAGCEWPAVNCKAIDLDAAFDVPEGAARLIVEEFLKRGPNEVGLSRQGRVVIELEAIAATR